MSNVSRGQVIHIAWPIILSNISTPLLGLVDTAVIGNLGQTALIGGIAIGALIFSFLYWGFGFLRMGTTALVAQAAGAKHIAEVKATFHRATLLGITIGICLLFLQVPIAHLSFFLLDGSQEVETAANGYFQIRILGAPLSLALLAVIGYLLGQKETRSVLWINLLLNGMNILLDLVFVVGFGWGIEGVAAATVISEFAALSFGLFVVFKHLHQIGTGFSINWTILLEVTALKRMLVVNRDLMIRTLCLLFAFAWFTNQGAQQGDTTLAANAILVQFVSFAAFFLDGFALAAETLVGSAVGAGDRQLVRRAIQYTFELGGLTAATLSMAYWIVGSRVAAVLTNVEAVRSTIDDYLIWAILTPVLSVWCYLLDGIFIGATRTIEMRNAMIISLLGFLLAWYLLFPWLGNHGLWLSLQLYFLLRAASLGYYFRRIQPRASAAG